MGGFLHVPLVRTGRGGSGRLFFAMKAPTTNKGTTSRPGGLVVWHLACLDFRRPQARTSEGSVARTAGLSGGHASAFGAFFFCSWPGKDSCLFPAIEVLHEELLTLETCHGMSRFLLLTSSLVARSSTLTVVHCSAFSRSSVKTMCVEWRVE